MISKILALIIVAFVTHSSFSQTQIKKNDTASIQTQINESPVYQLFPTQNIWIFIKLDTRNGKMWQVQFDIDSDNRSETVLNSNSLVSEEEELVSRFHLYPTQNMYNFILLDQIDGNVYQVQWSHDKKSRIVIPIN